MVLVFFGELRRFSHEKEGSAEVSELESSSQRVAQDSVGYVSPHGDCLQKTLFDCYVGDAFQLYWGIRLKGSTGEEEIVEHNVCVLELRAGFTSHLGVVSRSALECGEKGHNLGC